MSAFTKTELLALARRAEDQAAAARQLGQSRKGSRLLELADCAEAAAREV